MRVSERESVCVCVSERGRVCVCVNAKGKVNYSLYSIYLFVGALGRPRGCSTVMVGPSGTRVFMVIIAHFKAYMYNVFMYICTVCM